MAHIRAIKPEYFDDPDVGHLSAEAALVFVGIWTQADRAGRLIDDARRLKVRLRPYSSCDFDAILAELVDAGFLIRYQSEAGVRLLQVRSFGKHQKCHKLEPESHYPAPAEKDLDRSGSSRPVSCLLSLGSDPLSLEECAEPLCDSPPVIVVLEFPTTGAAKTWELTEAHLTDLARDYEHLDVLTECRKAFAWVKANPGRRKTAKGMPAFLVNWMNNAVARGGGHLAKTPRPLPQRDWRKQCQSMHSGSCPDEATHQAKLDVEADRIRNFRSEVNA